MDTGAATMTTERRLIGGGCAICGKNSYGQKYEGDQARRHRRFYFDFNEVTQTSRAVCGPCVKTIGGRCGK
jgi:hypothetical protein